MRDSSVRFRRARHSVTWLSLRRHPLVIGHLHALILASVIRTTTLRDLNPHAVLASLLHARTPHVAVELN